MNEQDIVKTFKVKKLLTDEEFAKIKDLTPNTALKALKALCNKGVMDKIVTEGQNGKEQQYYFLVEDTAKIKDIFNKKTKKKEKRNINNKSKIKSSNKTGNFYGNLVSLLDKEVVVLLNNGEARRGYLKSFEPNHLSIFIKDYVDGNLIMIRGNAIVVIREVTRE